MGDDPARDRALRRLAMQIAVQLPDEKREAMTVLRLVGQLVADFLDPEPGGGGAIRPFSVVKQHDATLQGG